MLPTFHMNNFKPWAPPHRKPLFSPHKSPNPYNPRTQKLSRPKPYHTSFPNTLPLPKHHLPARPPAEVCVHTSANAQPCTSLTSQFQPRQISIPQPNTYSENPKHSAASLHDSEPYISGPDPISRGDLQDDTGVPIAPPAFRGDSAEDGLSSPSTSSSDESLEGFFRLPDAQDDIPVDPAILANHGPWEDSDLQQSVPQADSFVNSEMACPYPDPPPVLHSPPDHHRDSSKRAGGQNGNIQTSNHPQIHDHQLHPSQHDTDPDPNGAHGNYHVGGQTKSSKRKTQRSDGQARKRLRVPSTVPPRKHSFIALRSHFMSLPLDERLQFLSWLFEGALPRCISDSSQQHAKTKMRGKSAARVHPTSVIAGRPREAQGRVFHGLQKRLTFC